MCQLDSTHPLTAIVTPPHGGECYDPYDSEDDYYDDSYDDDDVVNGGLPLLVLGWEWSHTNDPPPTEDTRIITNEAVITEVRQWKKTTWWERLAARFPDAPEVQVNQSSLYKFIIIIMGISLSNLYQ